jgi:hypothetical protein
MSVIFGPLGIDTFCTTDLNPSIPAMRRGKPLPLDGGDLLLDRYDMQIRFIRIGP